MLGPEASPRHPTRSPPPNGSKKYKPFKIKQKVTNLTLDNLVTCSANVSKEAMDEEEE